LYVQPARGWKPPRFSGTGGVIHPRIRQEMRKVLNERSLYSYLDGTCVDLLREARLAAAMTGACSSNLVSLGPKRTALMTWTGNRIQETLQVLFAAGNTEPRNEQIALVFDLPPDAVRHAVGRVAAMDIDLNTLARIMPRRNRRKYDWLLDDSLAALCTTTGWLDLGGARELLHAIA